MKKNFALAIVLSAVSFAACGNKMAANEKNFAAAMNQYFDKQGLLCLYTLRWPVVVSGVEYLKAKKMVVLENLGLVKSEDIEVTQRAFFSISKEKAKSYTLTDAATPFVWLEGTTGSGTPHLCWGKKALGKIVKWEGPMKSGDYQEAVITYTYKINNLADWARKPEVQAAFPLEVRTPLDNAASKKEFRHVIKRTNQGWEVKTEADLLLFW